jgi:hypothetical protein
MYVTLRVIVLQCSVRQVNLNVVLEVKKLHVSQMELIFLMLVTFLLGIVMEIDSMLHVIVVLVFYNRNLNVLMSR